MDVANQKLMWPPCCEETEQVDIVESILKKHSQLPAGCGLVRIEKGVRFDPEQFGDMSRSTQESLAALIVKCSGNGGCERMIKIKEYCSKARHRVRFSCCEDDCAVTFQVNYCSKAKHWFMKKNKGNFEHTCSGQRARRQLEAAADGESRADSEGDCANSGEKRNPSRKRKNGEPQDEDYTPNTQHPGNAKASRARTQKNHWDDDKPLSSAALYEMEQLARMKPPHPKTEKGTEVAEAPKVEEQAVSPEAQDEACRRERDVAGPATIVSPRVQADRHSVSLQARSESRSRRDEDDQPLLPLVVELPRFQVQRQPVSLQAPREVPCPGNGVGGQSLLPLVDFTTATDVSDQVAIPPHPANLAQPQVFQLINLPNGQQQLVELAPPPLAEPPVAILGPVFEPAEHVTMQKSEMLHHQAEMLRQQAEILEQRAELLERCPPERFDFGL